MLREVSLNAEAIVVGVVDEVAKGKTGSAEKHHTSSCHCGAAATAITAAPAMLREVILNAKGIVVGVVVVEVAKGLAPRLSVMLERWRPWCRLRLGCRLGRLCC